MYMPQLNKMCHTLEVHEPDGYSTSQLSHHSNSVRERACMTDLG